MRSITAVEDMVIKIGAKGVRYSGYDTVQLVEVPIPLNLFADTCGLGIGGTHVSRALAVCSWRGFQVRFC